MDLLLGDATKAKQQLGWTPKVTFKALAKMMTEADWELAKKEAYLANRK
ncbi:MAG: GDP-mannose 4,6-dehydratase [Tepidisphaeraceae bacterium]